VPFEAVAAREDERTMTKPTLMAVFAHPDDEAFGTGGTLTRYAAEGCDVYLVTATRGEAGQIAASGLATPSSLPYVREWELRCACDIYGIHAPRFLEYQDGQLPVVHQGQAVGKIVRLLRELRPEVVITFGPDGIYGHYDHIAVHHWTTIAVRLAAEPDCFPDQLTGACEPHHVSKLYYRVLPEDQIAAMAEGEEAAAVMMDDVPFRFVGWRPEQITTIVDVSDYLDQKLDGIRCHRSQLAPNNRFADTPDEVKEEIWFRQESYVLAETTVDRAEGTEADLFAGLR
jgi:LmbE family N-acetylglucosaminyl deacetylase